MGKKALVFIAFLAFLFLLSPSLTEAKKKKKGTKAKSVSSDEPEKSAKERPTFVSPELYCNACQAIVRELLKKLKHRTSESDVQANVSILQQVMDAMSDTCEPSQFMVYEFPPPDMREGCEAFIMDWEEVVERELIGREGNKGVENKICVHLSKACKNVNVKDAPHMDNEIFVDGQPVPIGEDGKVNLKKEEDL